jgi:hypothetical protein
MPAYVRHEVRSRVQSMTSPQSVRNRDRSQSVPAQIPRSVRRNVRATSGQLAGNVSQGADGLSAPKFAPKLAQWFANDLVITAAVRAAVHAASGESSRQLPGNFRVVSAQLAGNASHNAGEYPHHGWRNGSQVAWQFPLKSTQQITQQTGLRPRSDPHVVRLGVRATSDESSGNCWSISRQHPGISA